MTSRLLAINGIATIERALKDLEELLKEERKKAEPSSHEYMNQVVAQRELEYLNEVLLDSKYALRYVFLNVKCEDRLRLGPLGRYEIGETELSCGSRVDIFDEENCSWLTGRIEHSKELGGYYFCGSSNGYANKSLSVGMLARVRGE